MFTVGQTITISKDDFIKYAKLGLVLRYNHHDYYYYYHPTFEEQARCDGEDSADAEVQGYVLSHNYLTHEGAEHVWGNWTCFHHGGNFTVVKPPILKILKPRKSL